MPAKASTSAALRSASCALSVAGRAGSAMAAAMEFSWVFALATVASASSATASSGRFMATVPRSVDDVDGDRRRDRTGDVVSAGDHAHAEQHADVRVEVVLHRGREAERLAAA